MYDEKGQKARIEAVNKLVIDKYLKDLLPGGGLHGDKFPFGGRELLFFCEALFNTSPGYAGDADVILSGEKQFDGFCTFAPFMCALSLVRNKHALTPRLVGEFEAYVLRTLPINMKDMWDFVGVNDNTPAMIMTLLILAGKYFGREDAAEIGRKRLFKLKDMLTRRGFLSEFNSPTYYAVSLYALAACANYADDPKIRETALWCEQRVWETFMMQYHRDTCQAAGPYSRAYLPDSLGVFNQNRFLLYSVIGGGEPINAMNTIFSEESGNPAIPGFALFQQVSHAWIGNMTYHCPAEYAEAALSRRFPYVVRGDAEVSSSFERNVIPSATFFGEGDDVDFSGLLEQDDLYEYPAASSDIYTYLDNGYAVGTCTRPFHNGEPTDSFHMLFTKGGPAKDRTGVGTVFARYLLNDKSFVKGHIGDMGRKLAFQSENTAIALYRPKVSDEEISSLKLSLLFYNRHGIIDEIWLGSEKIYSGKPDSEALPVKKSGFVPVYVRAGDVYMAFCPLNAGGLFGEGAVSLGKDGDFLTISFVNYEGEPKKFHRKGLCLFPNGFVCEARNRAEAGSFEDFRAKFAFENVTDRMYANGHTRFTYMREVVYRRDGLEMACEYSPVSEGIKYMAVNGKTYGGVRLEEENLYGG